MFSLKYNAKQTEIKVCITVALITKKRTCSEKKFTCSEKVNWPERDSNPGMQFDTAWKILTFNH